VRVDIWSDVVCPWCYIGKRRFESALAGFSGRGNVEVVWRSFELDPAAPPVSALPLAAALAGKYGMTVDQAERAQERVSGLAAAEGLDYHLDRARPANSFDAHRLLHLAAERGCQDALKERLMRAYFTEGEAIGDRATLARLAADVGLDGPEVSGILDGTDFSSGVRADEEEATALGITGVPFFLVGGRYTLSGAQPVELFAEELARADAD
jgi:predicted DsbA family dithiol-disulfide isomerase